MLAGHFAAGFVGKRVEPSVSLGTFVLAAMLADLLWCVFMLAGWEQVHFEPGKGAANYLVASNIGWSHSLTMDALWAALFAAVYFLLRRHARAAWLLALVVLSHWVLDWISHRPDLQLSPGLHTYWGLGLWASLPATIIVEGGFWAFAVILYARASSPHNRLGSHLYWFGVAVLTLSWYSNLTGPPPRDPKLAPLVSVLFFSLAIGWAYWIDSLRSVRKVA